MQETREAKGTNIYAQNYTLSLTRAKKTKNAPTGNKLVFEMGGHLALFLRSLLRQQGHYW